ncbi:ester cyclase [Gordonia polyisoprenivorans]|uniref:ester cyclase n=1 Tax=Gordonia polyisoprenivorans TaxID=84595 RepID=UPI002300E21B|nr:ester cyclase [Gordonia polyisoprenivorans]WCB36900.1 ester cyclase [Gordonia polyisoprenivorans]
MSNLDDNKAVVRSFLSAADRHDRDAALALLHPDHELEYPGNDTTMNREAHWRLVASYHEAFADMVHRPDIQVAEGDRVVTRGTIFGTHTGPLQGMPATGRSTEVQFMNMARIVDGKICGLFSLLDTASLQKQLGLDDVLYRDADNH